MVAGLRIPGSHVTEGNAMVIFIALAAAQGAHAARPTQAAAVAARASCAGVRGIRCRIHGREPPHASGHQATRPRRAGMVDPHLGRGRSL